MTRSFVASLCMLILALSYTPQAWAQISLNPIDSETATVYAELAANQSIKGALLLSNHSDQEVTIDLYSADATQSLQGHMTLQTKFAPRRGLGNWIKLSQTLIILEPLEEKTIPYTIAIPSLTTPGDYGGGVAAQPISTHKEQSTGAVINTRNVISFIVKVPGERTTKIDWDSFTWNQTNKDTFDLTLGNQGNTALRIDGHITLTGYPFFQEKELPFEGITLFPGDTKNLPVKWQNPPMFAFVEANANLTYSEVNFSGEVSNVSETLRQKLSISFIPWNIIIVGSSVIGIIILLLILKAVQKYLFIKKCTPYNVQSGDTLEKLAANRNISWKKLAKINKIKPPYSLQEGQSIVLPPLKS